jgi:acyl-CoA synthetase (AMP-forming)/AMP-acid ligase II
MFHCNGWCFTWAVTAAGGTHVCLRAVDPAEIWRLLRAEGITHFSAAPTVLTMIAEDPAAGPLDREVHVDTGGAPPSATLLARLEKMRYARERLARYKVPKRMEFADLPKTSTGKIQKNVLRDMARERFGTS